MGKVVTFFEPKKVGITDYEDALLKPNEVRLQTLYSGISAGTELTHYRGSNVYLHKLWEDTDRLFLSGEGSTSKSYPIFGSGYEECGKVIELGSAVTKVKPGDIVYGTWQHRTHHIVSEDYAASRLLPVSLDEGDNDPARYISYLVKALQTIQAGIGEGLLAALQSPQPLQIETILTTLPQPNLHHP